MFETKILNHVVIGPKSGHKDQVEENEKFSKLFFAEIEKAENSQKIVLIKESLASLKNTDKTSIILKDAKIDEVCIPFNRICMLDMRAKSTLTKNDNQEFDAYIFGGVLGDHPPRDRCP